MGRQNTQNSQNSQVSRVATRQRTLSFAQATTSAPPDRRLSNFSGQIESNEIMSFLNTMQTDITQHNSQVRTDLNGLSSKMDTINQSIKEIKAENETLKDNNQKMSEQVSALREKVDNLEGHSRSNNLRIIGIIGTSDEKLDVCVEIK